MLMLCGEEEESSAELCWGVEAREVVGLACGRGWKLVDAKACFPR